MTDGTDTLEPEPLEPIEPAGKKRSPLPWVLGIVAVLALIVGVVVIAGDDDAADDPMALLSAAPDAVREEGSARMTMTMSMGETEGMDLGIEMEGVVDFETQAGSFEMSALGMDINMLTDGETIWIQMPFGGVGGKTWVAAPLEAMEGQEMAGFDSATGVLDSLRGVGGEIEEHGTEEINGVDATHYSTTIELADAIAATPQADRPEVEAALEQLGGFGGAGFPIDVWITDDGLPVRMVMTFAPPAGESGDALFGDGSFSMQVDFTDFGVPVEIEPPDPDEVHVVDDPSELGELFGGSSLG
jgi:hypothetical protein